MLFSTQQAVHMKRVEPEVTLSDTLAWCLSIRLQMRGIEVIPSLVSLESYILVNVMSEIINVRMTECLFEQALFLPCGMYIE